MIGPSLFRINHIPLADDYNRVIEALGPLQNLTVGGNLTLEQVNNGVAITGGGGAGEEFKYPFKVTAVDLSSATVAFGRVYEERVFKGDESTTTNLNYLELSSSTTFDTLSGMTITLNPVLNDETIVIAVNTSNDTSLTSNLYQVCLASSIPSGYFQAHVIAKLTKSTGQSWTIEQVLVGDYTFDRNPPVPFDITKYGTKWLMYVPAKSLVINGTDQSDVINGLTNVTALVGDWYELDPSKCYLTLVYGKDGYEGEAYGDVKTIEIEATDSSKENIKLFDTDGTKVLKQLVKGALNLEKIRVDSGDGVTTSKYKSLAVQGTYNGIELTANDYTLEMHGFKNALGPIGDPNDPDEVSYTYKIPIREQTVADGHTELRWTDWVPISGTITANISGEIKVNETNISSDLSALSVTFDYPFRVSPVPGNDGMIHISFGRVFEARDFVPDNTTITATTIKELSCANYQEVWGYSGIEIPIDPMSQSNQVVIAVNENNDSSLTKAKFFIKMVDSNIAEYNNANCVLANLRRDSTSDPWTVEQVHMGDYTFDRNPHVPFDITKYGHNKWLIYIPDNSLIVNFKDYSKSIANLTNGISPIVGDWYEITDVSYCWLNFSYPSSNKAGYIDATGISPYRSYATDIKLWDHDGSGITKQIQKGSINRSIISPDSGFEGYSSYKSIAVQGLDYGMDPSLDYTGQPKNTDFTLELHGFQSATELNSPIGASTDYSHKIAIREEYIANGGGAAELRWTDVASLSAVTGGAIDFPWKATYNAGTGNVDVVVGRVYHFQNFADTTTVECATYEMVNDSYPSSTLANIYCATYDFIGIYRDASTPSKWAFGTGSSNPGTTLLQKICYVYDNSGPTIEQIHMGDIQYTEPTVYAFSTSRNTYGDIIMYIPTGSIIINGQDYTSNALGNGVASGAIRSHSGDWYTFNTSGMFSIYIRLNDGVADYGTVGQTSVSNTPPTTPTYGELITIPLYDWNNKRLYHTGTLFKEIIRTDAHCPYGSSHGHQYYNRRSLDESVTGYTGDKTMQLRNFSNADANVAELSGDSNYSYTFVVRELDNTNGYNNAEIKYAPWEAMQTAIDNSVTNNFEENINYYFDTYWWDWYYDLSSNPDLSGNGFWVTGGNESTCHGSAIGDGTIKVIDLSTQTLYSKSGVWSSEGDISPTTNNSYSLGNSTNRWNNGYINYLWSSEIADANGTTSIGLTDRFLFGTGGTQDQSLNWSTKTLYGTWNLTNGDLQVGGNRVVSTQGAAIPDSDGTLSGNAAAINSILGAMRTHGLIAT